MVSYDLNLLLLPPLSWLFLNNLFLLINLENPSFVQVNLEWSSQRSWHTSQFKQVV